MVNEGILAVRKVCSLRRDLHIYADTQHLVEAPWAYRTGAEREKRAFGRSSCIRLREAVCGLPRISALRLSEKGTSNGPSEDLAAIRSAKWTEKPFLGGPLGYAGSASETFRTVSLGNW